MRLASLCGCCGEIKLLIRNQQASTSRPDVCGPNKIVHFWIQVLYSLVGFSLFRRSTFFFIVPHCEQQSSALKTKTRQDFFFLFFAFCAFDWFKTTQGVDTMRHVVSGTLLAIKQAHSKNGNSYSNLQFQIFKCLWVAGVTGSGRKLAIVEHIYLHVSCKWGK